MNSSAPDFSSAPVGARSVFREAMMWLGLVLVLTPMLFRAITQTTTLPYWDMDPLLSWSPMVGIGPAGSLLVDALIMFGAGLLLIATARQARGRGLLLAALLVAIGCVPIVYHGWSSTIFTLGQQRVGAAWASAMMAGLALWHAGSDRRVRIVAFAAIISVAAVLAFRGIEQVFIEHPGTVENFKRNRDAILAAQGWPPDSAMARGYERRLMQAEATGWFGLSNVYASFAAASSVAFVALAWLTWVGRKVDRDRAGRLTTPSSPWPMVLSVAGLLLSLAALALADSKGGFAAAPMGIVLVAGAMWVSRSGAANLPPHLSRVATWLGPALVAVALLAVVARGLIGERIRELSVLFRWFYMQAATRIAMHQPLLGVGPDGFKDAYLIFKNPLSPEEVGSPHSILFDWWACLGLCGLAWIGLWLWWAARAGANLLQAAVVEPLARDGHDLEARPLIRGTSGIIILATLTAIWTETAALTPEAALIRILGLGVWLVLAGGVVVVAIKHPRWLIAAAAAAIVMAVHSQVEVTGSFVQSAGLFVAVIALAASRSNRQVLHSPNAAASPVPGEFGKLTANVVGMLVLVAGGLLCWAGVSPALRWEAGLRHSALAVRPLAEVSQLLSAAQSPASPAYQPDAIEQAARTLSDALGRSVGSTPESINAAMRELFPKAAKQAAVELSELEELDWRTLRESMRLALLVWDTPDPSLRTWAGGVFGEQLTRSVLGRKIGRSPPNQAAREAAAMAAYEELARRASDRPDVREHWLEIAAHYTDSAPKLDPYNLPLAVRVLRFQQRHGTPEAVLTSARRVLEVDDLQRLDRSVRGLTATERREVEDLIKRLEAAQSPAIPDAASGLAKPAEPAPKPTPTNP